MRTGFPTFQGSRGTTVLEGLTQKDPNDSSCDALKEVFNNFGNEGSDQYDRFGDLRSEIAQQYITSGSLSSNANLLLSTTRHEAAANSITQQLRELKGQQLFICVSQLTRVCNVKVVYRRHLVLLHSVMIIWDRNQYLHQVY